VRYGVEILDRVDTLMKINRSFQDGIKCWFCRVSSLLLESVDGIASYYEAELSSISSHEANPLFVL
jgi:hypothetical protein